MMARVKFRGGEVEATVDGGVWTCPAEPSLADLLNARAANVSTAGLPDRDRGLARDAADVLGGEVVDWGEPPEMGPPGVKYE